MLIILTYILYIAFLLYYFSASQNWIRTYTLINKGVSRRFHRRTILVPQRSIQSKNISFLPFYNLKHLLSPQRTQNGSSEVKGSSWSHLDERLLLGIVQQLYFKRVWWLNDFRCSFNECQWLISVAHHVCDVCGDTWHYWRGSIQLFPAEHQGQIYNNRHTSSSKPGHSCIIYTLNKNTHSNTV